MLIQMFHRCPVRLINCCFLPSLNSFSPPLRTITKTVRLTQGWTLHHLILPFGGCHLRYLNGLNGIADTFFLLPTCLLLFHLFHHLAWKLRGSVSLSAAESSSVMTISRF